MSYVTLHGEPELCREDLNLADLQLANGALTMQRGSKLGREDLHFAERDLRLQRGP